MTWAKRPDQFVGEVASSEPYVWSARDHELGSTGRRPGDPEYTGYVFLRGVLHPRSLADDGARLLNAKERAAFEYTLACAHRDPMGRAIVMEEHLPDAIRRMPGPNPRQVTVNTGRDGVVYEPRWNLYTADGGLLGGALAPDQQRPAVRQTAHLHHRDRVYHHPAPQPQPGNARVDERTLIHHHHAPEHVYLSQAAQSSGAQPGHLTGRVRRKV